MGKAMSLGVHRMFLLQEPWKLTYNPRWSRSIHYSRKLGARWYGETRECGTISRVLMHWPQRPPAGMLFADAFKDLGRGFDSFGKQMLPKEAQASPALTFRRLNEVGGHSPSVGPGVFLAANSQLYGNVKVGSGCTVWYEAVLRGECAIDSGAHIRDRAVVIDSTVGTGAIIEANAIVEGAAIGPNAYIGRRAVIGKGAKVGAGAHIRPGAVVAAGAQIAEGALVECNDSVSESVPEKFQELYRERAAQYASDAPAHQVMNEMGTQESIEERYALSGLIYQLRRGWSNRNSWGNRRMPEL